MEKFGLLQHASLRMTQCCWQKVREFCRKIGKENRSKVLAKERLGKEEVGEEYRRKLSERLRGCVNDVYDVFKGTVIEVADEVVGWRESGVKRPLRCGVSSPRGRLTPPYFSAYGMCVRCITNVPKK